MEYRYLTENWPNVYKKKPYCVFEVVGPTPYSLYLPPFFSQIVNPKEFFAIPEEFLYVIEFAVKNIPGLNVVLMKKVVVRTA